MLYNDETQPAACQNLEAPGPCRGLRGEGQSPTKLIDLRQSQQETCPGHAPAPAGEHQPNNRQPGVCFVL